MRFANLAPERPSSSAPVSAARPNGSVKLPRLLSATFPVSFRPRFTGTRAGLLLGLWGESPALLFLGRLHFYEGHPREVVTGTVRVAADLGVKRLILTNAAGGIHPSLDPGALMAIRGHIKIVGRDAWRELPKGIGSVERLRLQLTRAARIRDLGGP